MEDFEKESYFSKVPNEIKVFMLGLLNTPDFINFCIAYPNYNYFADDKDVVKFISFYKAYNLDIEQIGKFISQKPRCEYITSLNINCVYWITASEFRKYLTKLESLECLYALDTALSVTEQDCLFYAGFLKLRKLAVPLIGKDFTHNSVKLFPPVTHLCLHLYVSTADTVCFLSILLRRLECLQEIWIIDRNLHTVNVSNMVFALPDHIKKATFLFNNYMHNTTRVQRMTKTFQAKRKGREMCFEENNNVIDIYSDWKIDDLVWKGLLHDLHCEYPFGRADAKLLSTQKCTLSNIRFKELNFTHTDTVCCGRLRFLVSQALLSPNTRYLKKLSINFCICEDIKHDEVAHTVKRPRSDSEMLKQTKFELITEYCQLLEELEIWGCEKALLSQLPALRYIAQLQNLKRLSLIDVPLQVRGDFLLEVCQSCKQLESLRIRPLKYNAYFNKLVCAAIQYANNLKDFRYEHMYIPLDEIFTSLATIKNSKLERLFLKCVSVEKFSVAPFDNFLKSANHLIFMFVVITEMPKIHLRNIQTTLNSYKNGKQKILYAVQDESVFTGRMPIPDIHKHDILLQETRIAVLDIFNDFIYC